MSLQNHATASADNGVASQVQIEQMQRQLSRPQPRYELHPPGMGNHPPDRDRDRAIAAKVADMQARIVARRGMARAEFGDATALPIRVEQVTSQQSMEQLQARAQQAANQGNGPGAEALAAKAAQIEHDLAIRQGAARQAFKRASRGR